MKKTAVITGASRGIGRACAVALARCGFDVLINYRIDSQAAETTASICREYGARAFTFCADVSDENKVREMFDFAERELGGVGALVNNAGVSSDGLFCDISRAEYERVFDVNVWGQVVCAREAARRMVREQCGKIVNISSMWGIVGASCEVVYSASKAAVIGLTKALAKELAPSGITVNCVAPGVIDTDMNACYNKATMDDLSEQTPLGRLGKAEDVAGAVAFLLGDGGDFITGEVLRVDGGFVI